MDQIERIEDYMDGDQTSVSPQQAIDKINELVDRVNQLAKPILVCKVPGVILRKYEGDPSSIVDRITTSIKEVVKDDYHILTVTDDMVANISFEVHNQQTEIGKTLMIQLQNLKIPSKNGEQA